jgi:1-deoxyxylulose-5-phosphate synthase
VEYVRLGRTGLQVSRICLGCMSYGQPEIPGVLHWAWTLSEQDSRPFITRALELGVNFFDTANVYSNGESEAILGRAIKDFAPRDDVVIATKVWGPVRKGPNGRGLSRKAIMSEVDKSLRRLGTDYIDLYWIHRFDYDTPLEETLEALNDVVRAGKARYLGASSMYAWQFMKAIGMQRANGWAPFVAMQNYYNLLYREDEREMLGLCMSEGIGVTPGRRWRAAGWRVHGRMRPPPTAPRPTLSPVRSSTRRWTSTSRSSTACRMSRGRAVYRPRRSRWPGCCASPSSHRRLSVRRSRTIWRMPSPHFP